MVSDWSFTRTVLVDWKKKRARGSKEKGMRK